MRANLISVVLSVALASVAFAGPAAAGGARTAGASSAPSLSSLPETLTPEELRKLPPAVQQAWVMQKVAKQRSQAKAAGLDTVGPTLSTFDARPTVSAGSPLVVRVGLSDDLSGVKTFVALASSSHTLLPMMVYTQTAPTLRLNASMAIDVSRDVLAGAYEFFYAYAYDDAGNYTEFFADDLNAAGNGRFQVNNAKRGDSKPASIVSARILTPQLSLSAFNPGTNKPAYVKVSVTAQDFGDLSISGVKRVHVDFCAAAPRRCFSLIDGPTLAPGQANLTFTIGTQPGLQGVTPGDYYACNMRVYDWLEFETEYPEPECGSNTVNPLFPAGSKITLTP